MKIFCSFFPSPDFPWMAIITFTKWKPNFINLIDYWHIDLIDYWPFGVLFAGRGVADLFGEGVNRKKKKTTVCWNSISFKFLHSHLPLCLPFNSILLIPWLNMKLGNTCIKTIYQFMKKPSQTYVRSGETYKKSSRGRTLIKHDREFGACAY